MAAKTKLVMTEPKLEDRSKQPYMGVRTQVPIREVEECYSPIARRSVGLVGPSRA